MLQDQLTKDSESHAGRSQIKNKLVRSCRKSSVFSQCLKGGREQNGMTLRDETEHSRLLWQRLEKHDHQRLTVAMSE